MIITYLHETFVVCVLGEGPFPAVLDLGTFMSEKRACLLANKGFLVLTIAVFSDRQNMKEIHLDPFKEAVDFLRHHPKVGPVGDI